MKVLNKTAARLATPLTCSLLALVVQAAEIPARGILFCDELVSI